MINQLTEENMSNLDHIAIEHWTQKQ